MNLNKSDFRPYYSTKNLPNGYKDSITGTEYTYESGNAAEREAALRSLRDAQITAIATLISGGYTTAEHVGDLVALKAAYAASLE